MKQKRKLPLTVMVFGAVFLFFTFIAAWTGFAYIFALVVHGGVLVDLQDYLLGGCAGVFFTMMISLVLSVFIGVIDSVGFKIWGNE